MFGLLVNRIYKFKSYLIIYEYNSDNFTITFNIMK